jgi:hypothetical protein
MKRCEARTNGGGQCELPDDGHSHHHVTIGGDSWMEWTDKSMKEFARVAAEMAARECGS